MSESAEQGRTGGGSGRPGLALRLAMAMFVLVVDTSLMNVSISAVVQDLDTTVSGVQSAIALEALVSAAFILIGSKVGDLIGRKRAYVARPARLRRRRHRDDVRAEPRADHHLLGGHRRHRRLAAAAVDAVAHPRQLRGRRRRSRSTRSSVPPRRSPPRWARCSAASSRRSSRGGSASCSRPWSSPSCSPACARSRTCPTPGRARSTGSAPCCRSSAWAASCSASWSGRRAARPSACCSAIGALGLVGLASWLRAAQARGQGRADRPGPVQLEAVPLRRERPAAAADRPRRHDDRAADLPADGAGVQRAAGRASPSPRSR